MPQGSILGHPVRRTEDPDLVTGRARFVADLPVESLHVVFVRSPFAHARITRVDLEEARGMPGVAGVFVGADLGLAPMTPGTVPPGFGRPVLAEGVVRFAGEPVAVVVAETVAQAMDAAELVAIEYDPLPVVVDPVAALDDEGPLLFPGEGTNVAMDSDVGDRRALDRADVVVRARFVNQRLAPLPMEGNAALAEPDLDTGGLTLWASCQAPHYWRSGVAEPLGLKERQVRVVAPSVGGGFGAKIDVYPETLVVCALALRLGRAVRWVEERSENLLSMTHGRAQVHDVELGARRDGTITGLRFRLVQDGGAYPGLVAYQPALTHLMTSGVYRIPKIDAHLLLVATTTTPVNAYRGAGRPEAAAMVERAMDMLADELRIDPVELRRRNLIPKDAFPVTTAAGATYDSGDYEAALDAVLRLAGYEELRGEQARRRQRGDRRQLGIGVSVYVEVTAYAGGTEFGSVEVQPDGSVTVLTGTSPHGQGHNTAFAQIVADALGVPFESVRVVHSDTALVPRGDGTMGSRSAQVGGSAVLRASEAVVEKARRVAAHLLEASPEDVVLFDDGRIGIAGAPDRALTWAEVAAAATDPSRVPEGMEPGLAEKTDFSQDSSGTYPFGAHVSVVEVDIETGQVRPLRHIAVDDCGRIINPMLAEGQVHGGIGQGMAQALYEEVRFDEDGTPLTANLTAYEMPSSADLPAFETAHTITPTPLNPLGAKGIGESATIGSTPAVQNAVVDALSHLGVRHIDMPCTPERVWRAIRDAAQGPERATDRPGGGSLV
jgi:aerobic carbon-monoxide dehydrogenase large subunit